MPDINMTMTQAQAVSMTLTGGGAVTAARVAAVGAVMDTDFTAADEVMVGTGTGTHQQVTLGASELLGKKATGAVTNVTGADARTILGLGTAAVASTGVAVGNVPVLGDIGGGVAGLPAVDGSLLTGLSSGATTGNLVLISEATSDGSDTALAIDGIGYSIYKDYVLRISDCAMFTAAGESIQVIWRKSGSPYMDANPVGRRMWVDKNSSTFTGTIVYVWGPLISYVNYGQASAAMKLHGEVKFSLVQDKWIPFYAWTINAYTDVNFAGFSLSGGHHPYTGNPDGVQIRGISGSAFVAGSKIQLFGVVA